MAPESTPPDKTEAPVSDREDKAETSAGSETSDVGSVSDSEEWLRLDESGQGSSPSLLRADAPEFIFARSQLSADAREFLPGHRQLNPSAACYNPSIRALKQAAASLPAAPPGLQTKLSSRAGSFVPSSVKAPVTFHQAATSMPGPPPGLRTKLSCRAGAFVPSSSG